MIENYNIKIVNSRTLLEGIEAHDKLYKEFGERMSAVGVGEFDIQMRTNHSGVVLSVIMHLIIGPDVRRLNHLVTNFEAKTSEHRIDGHEVFRSIVETMLVNLEVKNEN